MRIFVGNLHTHASEGALRDLFGNYGEIVSVTVIMDEEGKSGGHAYIEMKNEQEAQKAIVQLNRINYMNQFLDVYEIG